MRPSKKQRREMIEKVLKDFEFLKSGLGIQEQYAVEANIEFFKAIRSRTAYIKWMLKKAPKLDGDKLFEVNDILIQWDREMHQGLIAMEKRKFPGLVKPLVERLVKLISARGSQTTIMGNLGSGGMEIERQVIHALQAKPHSGKVIFVGVDRSPIAQEMAKENLADIASLAETRQFEKLDGEHLRDIADSAKKNYTVIMCKNDIFKLADDFPEKTFDIVFHSLFKHHLNQGQKESIDRILAQISRRVLEYDGYKSWGVVLPQSLSVWSQPILLNATIFSDLRYTDKKKLQKLKELINENIVFFPKLGIYLREKVNS